MHRPSYVCTIYLEIWPIIYYKLEIYGSRVYHIHCAQLEVEASNGIGYRLPSLHQKGFLK